MHPALQVTLALAHLHSCGIIHRDLKAANVFLTGDGQTFKLADFGVCRILWETGEVRGRYCCCLLRCC